MEKRQLTERPAGCLTAHVGRLVGTCPCDATLSDCLSDGWTLARAVRGNALPPGTLGSSTVAPCHHRHERRMEKRQLTEGPAGCLTAHVGRLVGTCPCNATLSDGLTDGWSLARASSAGAAPPDTIGTIAVTPYHHRHERRMVKGQLTKGPKAASLLIVGRLVGTCPRDATLSDG